jgi:hypothetical protein
VFARFIPILREYHRDLEPHVGSVLIFENQIRVSSSEPKNISECSMQCRVLKKHFIRTDGTVPYMIIDNRSRVEATNLVVVSVKSSIRQVQSENALFLLLFLSSTSLRSTPGMFWIGPCGKVVAGRLLPVAGRSLKAAHEKPINLPETFLYINCPNTNMVLSHCLWRQEFPLSPAIVFKT